MQCPLFSNYSVLQDGIKGPVLNWKRVYVGSRLGLVVDTDRSLHLYADGKDQGVVASHIPDPCYFMFDLFNHCTKVLTVSLFLYYFPRCYCSSCCRCCCFMFTVFLTLLVPSVFTLYRHSVVMQSVYTETFGIFVFC